MCSLKFWTDFEGMVLALRRLRLEALQVIAPAARSGAAGVRAQQRNNHQRRSLFDDSSPFSCFLRLFHMLFHSIIHRWERALGAVAVRISSPGCGGAHCGPWQGSLRAGCGRAARGCGRVQSRPSRGVALALRRTGLIAGRVGKWSKCVVWGGGASGGPVVCLCCDLRAGEGGIKTGLRWLERFSSQQGWCTWPRCNSRLLVCCVSLCHVALGRLSAWLAGRPCIGSCSRRMCKCGAWHGCERLW